MPLEGYTVELFFRVISSFCFFLMHTTIIQDCTDENAVGRLAARTASLFSGSVQMVRVSEYPLQTSASIIAAGWLVDMIDAYEDREGVILVNAAPRGEKTPGMPNGNPFGYFRYKNVLVVSTIGGYTLSLAHRLGIVEEMSVFDIRTVLASLPDAVRPDADECERIVRTQFRSYEFQPRVAKWLWDGIDVAAKSFDLSTMPALPPSIFHIDNF